MSPNGQSMEVPSNDATFRKSRAGIVKAPTPEIKKLQLEAEGSLSTASLARDEHPKESWNLREVWFAGTHSDMYVDKSFLLLLLIDLSINQWGRE